MGVGHQTFFGAPSDDVVCCGRKPKAQFGRQKGPADVDATSGGQEGFTLGHKVFFER